MRSISLAFLFVVAACGPNVSGDDDDGSAPDSGQNEACTGTGTRCVGTTWQQCTGGHWTDVESCSGTDVCAPSIGCAQCDPGLVNTCQGNDKHVCNPDGTIGGFIETCPGLDNTCVDGQCVGDDGCSENAKLIYVVDDNYDLLSFNPAMDLNTFTLIGHLNCPAGPSWPDWADPQATPFSMGVDRTGRAWVLYTSGEIFWVSTVDASCTPSPFVKGSNGYQLFGMAFVSDAAGSELEHLFISGGSVLDIMNATNEHLGSIDPAAPSSITTIGSIPQYEYSPELSGTGNGELYGYFPGMSQTFVAGFDKTNASFLPGKMWNLPGLSGQVYAWAFAHWGGRFYIFVTDGDILGTSRNSHVFRLDPATGAAPEILSNQPYYIVGAGVSTCAPVVIP